MEEQNNTKNQFLDWSHLGFVGVCAISFAVALVFAIEVPLKSAFIFWLFPIGGIVFIVLCLSCIFKLSPKIWRNQYRRVAKNENYTKAIKSILFPILLVILYFYIQ